MAKTKQATCKLCGVTFGCSHEQICSPCAHKKGLCIRCKCKPQDRPGFKICARCDQTMKNWRDRLEARIGQRGAIPEWKIRQIEKDRQFAAQLVEKFKQDLANANG